MPNVETSTSNLIKGQVAQDMIRAMAQGQENSLQIREIDQLNSIMPVNCVEKQILIRKSPIVIKKSLIAQFNFQLAPKSVSRNGPQLI